MIYKFIKTWAIPVFVALSFLLIFNPALAQFTPNLDLFPSDYLKDNNVEVGSETVDGYSQVYYLIEGDKEFITEGSTNSTLPHTSGEYIVYRKSLVGGDQIFLYNILKGQAVQLTYSRNNTNPRVSKNGNVVWERWIQDSWQIFLYDGIKIIQLTSEDLSLSPDINEDYAIYARRDIAGTYRSEIYSIGEGKTKEVAIGMPSKKPTLESGKIMLKGEGVEEFPLKPEDFFVLDLASMSNSEGPITVTVDEISNEFITPSIIGSAEVKDASDSAKKSR